jgi:ubiquinone/menaquinone biosynthesis C-methylase UbiE
MNTEIFTGKAEVYVKARPSYPYDAVEYICSLASPNAFFADIGAGTGKFTELIAKRGYSLFAIEPNLDMWAELVKTLKPYPAANVINASAEATMLPDQSVDIITVAQALHWFELDSFRVECRRICKLGGIVIAVYNIKQGKSGLAHLSQTSTDAFFKNPTVRKFPYPISFTRERWLQYMQTRPRDPLPGDPGYATHMSEMNAIFDKESIDGLLHQLVTTTVYSEVLLQNEC